MASNRFDVAGAGACLKRYTDPSFFKVEVASSGKATEVQREKKNRKVKVLQWKDHNHITSFPLGNLLIIQIYGLF